MMAMFLQTDRARVNMDTVRFVHSIEMARGKADTVHAVLVFDERHDLLVKCKRSDLEAVLSRPLVETKYSKDLR